MQGVVVFGTVGFEEAVLLQHRGVSWALGVCGAAGVAGCGGDAVWPRGAGQTGWG